MNAPSGLFAALAALQADLPRIGKGNTADVKNNEGKKLYSYKFADLADVSQAIFPKLAAQGLAFTSKPTLVDGQFVLVYKLTHTSGQSEEGMYPLPANGTPQAIGGAITYARRYSLCAVTGCAPDGDDDDAGAVEQTYQRSAGDVFEQSKPARPMNQGPREPATAPRGQAARPAAVPRATGFDDAAAVQAETGHAQRMTSVPADDPWYDAPAPDSTPPAAQARPRATRPTAVETDPAWLDLIGKDIDRITSKADGAKVWAKIVSAYSDRTCTPADRKALEGMVGAKVAAALNQAEATQGAAA